MPIILCIFLLLSFCETSNAVTVSGVSGTIADGQSITIVGIDFGANGPSVLMFDDFELGTNDTALDLGAGSAQVGQWDSIDTPAGSTYSTDYAVSGSLAGHWVNTHYSTGIQTRPPDDGTDKIFISYWTMIPSGYTIPANWKIVWLQGDGTADDDVVFTTLMGTSGGLMNGNETDWSEYSSINFSIGSWRRHWAYIEGTTTATGVVKTWTFNSGVVQTINVSDAYIFAADSTPDTNYNFERVVVNGYFGSGDAGTPCYFDDVYIAYGDYAQARVEIGNASTYAGCTTLTVVTPTSWSNSSITGVFREGQFSVDDIAYIYVFDSTGAVNATGYEITIGSSETDTGLSVTGSCYGTCQ